MRVRKKLGEKSEIFVTFLTEAMVSKRLENIWRMLSRSTLKKAVPLNKVIL